MTACLPKSVSAMALLRMAILVALIVATVLTMSQASAIAPKTLVRPGKADEDLDWDTPRDIGSLINILRTGKRTFDWNDWLNLDKTKFFYNKDLDAKLYPHLVECNLGEIEFPPRKESSSLENAMIGSLFAKYNMSHPSRIIVLADPSNPETKGGMEIFDLNDPPKDKCHKQFGHSECTLPQNISEPLVEQLNNSTAIKSIDRLTVDVPNDLYAWNLNQQDLREKAKSRDIKPGDRSHVVTLEQALANIPNSKKHFYEVPLKNDPASYGGHYDWRFFRGIKGFEDHVKSVQNIARAWSQFADTMGILYWYAHGSLLGWWWNGLTMPWDSDHDIQMPILELDRFAKIFNGSMVVTHENGDYNMYYIDVSPYYVERTQGNGHNLIDARFIDVQRGTYIDITGLAYAKMKKKVNCKNNHIYSVQDISPLRRSLFEGVASMVPKENERMLQVEYKAFRSHSYFKWAFNDKIRLWQITVPCSDYLKIFAGDARVFCFPKEDLPEDQCDFDTFDTCDRPSIESFNASGTVTAMHQIENELWEKLSTHEDEGEVARDLAELLDEYYPPFH